VIKFQNTLVNEDATFKSLVARLRGIKVNPPREVEEFLPDDYFDNLE
jgi:hypothetical protein